VRSPGDPEATMGKNIGFISTRFKGTDGVSLESGKWAEVLWDERHVSYWFSGATDRHPKLSVVIPEAALDAEENLWINERVLGRTSRDRTVTAKILDISGFLKDTLYEFVKRFDVDVLIAENALSIPMHIPLGVALTQFLAETGMPTIAHHHDFHWERTRFSINAANDLLAMAFPPALPSIQHVTISTFAQQQLSWRKGESSVVVPNVLDFDSPPDLGDHRGTEFRKAVGLEEDDVVFLQPTRVIPRKGIEHSISLLAQLDRPRCKLIVSHEVGDEGHDYKRALVDMAHDEGVDLRFVDTHVGEIRMERKGVPVFTLEDAYAQADFITYPSLHEGFGNALIEAFYYRKPILVNRYSIFVTDIEPKGFQVISMDGYLTRDVVQQVRRVIDDVDYRRRMIDQN
jgi:glycosyltransferase involved in cell wall biosynthesis